VEKSPAQILEKLTESATLQSYDRMSRTSAVFKDFLRNCDGSSPYWRSRGLKQFGTQVGEGRP
jgi:hypothetical protein